MDAAPAQGFEGRGAPRLLEHFAAFERITSGDGPSARIRLEREVGWELAELLVGALAGAGGSGTCSVWA